MRDWIQREEMTGSVLHGPLVVEPELPALLSVHVPFKLHTSDLGQPIACDPGASVAKEGPGQQTPVQASPEGLCPPELQMSTSPSCCSCAFLWSWLLSWFAFGCSPLSLHACTIWDWNSAEELRSFAYPLRHVRPCGPTPTQIYQVQSVLLLLFLIA